MVHLYSQQGVRLVAPPKIIDVEEKMSKNSTPETLTVAELAEYLHLHPLTARNLIRKGEIPAYRAGREWRVDRAVLDRWIVERTKEHAPGTVKHKGV